MTLPHDFGPAFDPTGWTFTCDLKRCVIQQQVPPDSVPVVASLPVLPIADTGLGRAGVAVSISGAVTGVLEAGGLPYALDIRGVKAGSQPYVSGPVFVSIVDVVTRP